MPIVQPCEVPLNSLLRRYQVATGFADCYLVEVVGSVTQAAFVEAFYTSPLFKIERTILKLLARKPASDADVLALASGRARTFSAWRVEGQSPSELLLADLTGRTRSWLMAQPEAASDRPAMTRLFFGSAVVPREHGAGRRPRMGGLFHALLGFHRLYSRLLLSAAAKRAVRR